jgi:hypothetical protein
MKVDPEYEDCVLVPGRAIVLVLEEAVQDYDPMSCVTAKELRDSGVQIPLEIPDQAWVPKNKVRYDIKAADTTYDASAQRINSVIPVHIDVDFKWHLVTVEESAERNVITTTECSATLREK